MFGYQPRRILLALLAGLALTTFSPAQPRAELGMPVLHNYTAKETNGASQVWAITQDARGVLYFSTANAIVEYDGVTWRRIPIPSSVSRCFAIDSTGRIWVGANATFGYLEPDPNGTLKFVSLLEKIPQEDRKFNDVWQVLITPEGNYFRSYERLFRWDGKSMHVWSTNGRFEALSEIRG